MAYGFRALWAMALPAVLAAAIVPPAAACTPEPGYRVPGNLELVGEAETIVVAQVTGATLAEDDPEASTIRIRPLAAVKGPLPQGEIALRGMMLARDAGPELGVLSNPYDFERAHPVSYIGACTRFVFPLGTTALFFLRTDHEGMWAPAGGAFTRWAEDVPDVGAPWVQLARFYTIAAGLPEEDRAGFLEDEREALFARADDPVAQLMAADIARQLAGPRQAPDLGLSGEEDAAETESAVEAALRKMRQAAIEGGN